MPIFRPVGRAVMGGLVVAGAGLLAFVAVPRPSAGEPGGFTLRPGGDVALIPETLQIAGVVPRDITLDALLRGQGVAGEAAQRLITAIRPVFDARRLRAHQPFSLLRTPAGALRHFQYEIDNDSVLQVASSGAGGDALEALVLPIPKTLEHAVARGTIGGATRSLFEAMDAAGERPDLSIALAEIFSGQIDFSSELQPDDRFVVAFERVRREGRPATYGAVTAAEFQNAGRVMRAIRFAPPGQPADYFDEQGRALRRFFLRSPLKFEPRVTSRFSAGRLHPLLHLTRAHQGVDYAAPAGAPVVAVASGAVVSATVDAANGRMIRLRHASGYESSYLHLSAFAAQIHSGAHVSQGDVIGRVGATGLATGPHLHYALRKNGTYVNPLREQRTLPPGEPVPASALEAFHAVRDRALPQIASSARTPTARR